MAKDKEDKNKAKPRAVNVKFSVAIKKIAGHSPKKKQEAKVENKSSKESSLK